MVNVFRISGDFNVAVMIAASNLRTIEKIMDVCFRQDPNVSNIRSAMIIQSIHDFVIPIDFSVERFNEAFCHQGGCHTNKNIHQFRFDKD